MKSKEKMSSYKVLLVGDGGVGKTSYVNRICKGSFEKKYIPTMGVEVNPLALNTTHGQITFNFWDTAGQEKFCGIRDGYYIKSNAAIVMFDVTSRTSFLNIKNWIQDINRVCGKIPIVICGNKVDEKGRKVLPMDIRSFLDELDRYDIKYYDLSSKTNYNFEKPILNIARLIRGDPDLNITESDAIEPQEVDISSFQLDMDLKDISFQLKNL